MSFMPEIKEKIVLKIEPVEEPIEPEEKAEENEEERVEEEEEEGEEEYSDEEEYVPKVIHEEYSQEDIFIKEKPKKAKPIEVAPKLTKKGLPRKKRPPMSDEHKEKLKYAREKAMASRRVKAKERADVKALDMEEKELLKKQRIKKVKKLKEEVEDGGDNDNDKSNIVKENRSARFTKKDLEDAQLEAITKYETLRKARKEVKKVKQAEDKVNQDFKDQLTRAIAPQRAFNPYAKCY